MKIVFIALIIVLSLLAAIFIAIPFVKQKQKKQLPFTIVILSIIFAGIWYAKTGEYEHIIYAEDDKHLKQISTLLNSDIPLTPEMQQSISAELQRQEPRKSAAPSVWLLQGQLAMQQGHYDDAVKAYQKAYQYVPEDKDIALLYARALYQKTK